MYVDVLIRQCVNYFSLSPAVPLAIMYVDVLIRLLLTASVEVLQFSQPICIDVLLRQCVNYVS